MTQFATTATAATAATGKIAMPPLANYVQLRHYIPQYGDIIIWAGWFSTWFGVAADFDSRSTTLEIIFGGLPVLLLTMPELEYRRNTRKIELARIRDARPGVWAVLRHDPQRNAIIWYV